MGRKVDILDIAGTETSYYAPATITSASDIIHISGQVGATRQGIVPPDYESQVHLALFNIRRILVAANTSVSSIAKLILYIVSSEVPARKHTKIIQKFLGPHRPAITLVPLTQLARPGWLIEIDAVIAKDAPVLSPSLSALSTVPTVDVVVMGAGLAGLTAAQHICKAGYSCVVLEARNRVGGRTWSQKLPSGDAVFDVGAAWINDTNQSRMASLAQAFGAEFIVQNSTGNAIFEDVDHSISHYPYGELPRFSETVQTHIAQIRDQVEADCQSLSVTTTTDARSTELDSLTFLAYLKQLGANYQAISTATIWTRAMVGQEPSDISALYFLLYCKAGGGLMQMRSDRKGGGQHLRIRQGTQMFSINLAASLPKDTVRLNSPVSRVHSLSTNSTLVSCRNNGPTFRTKKVLSAIPIPVLKTVEFTPPLPPAKTLLLDSYRYGYYQKVLVVFKTPFWISRGFCGLVQSFTGPACVIRDSSVPMDDKHVLICFVGGAVGETWSRLPTLEARQEAILAQIETVFEDRELVRGQYVEMTGLQWRDEGWSGYGCPSPVLGPGVLSAVGEVLTASVGDVYFAGTETSDVWRGYMEGAVRSGDREAERIIRDLRGVVAKI